MKIYSPAFLFRVLFRLLIVLMLLMGFFLSSPYNPSIRASGFDFDDDINGSSTPNGFNTFDFPDVYRYEGFSSPCYRSDNHPNSNAFIISGRVALFLGKPQKKDFMTGFISGTINLKIPVRSFSLDYSGGETSIEAYGDGDVFLDSQSGATNLNTGRMSRLAVNTNNAIKKIVVKTNSTFFCHLNNPSLNGTDADIYLFLDNLNVYSGNGLQKGETFISNNLITFPSAENKQPGPSKPYPSIINVSGLIGPVKKVTLTIFQYQGPHNYDILLVAPNGRKLILMSGTAFQYDFTRYRTPSSVVFDDDATAMAPNTGIVSDNAFKPTNYSPNCNSFPCTNISSSTNVIVGPFENKLASFKGASPNGDWKLYVYDTTAIGPSNSFDSIRGWTLTITTEQVATEVAQPSDLIPQLRVTPDRMASNNPENLISYTFKVNNVGLGTASSLRLELPIDPTLEVGYTNFVNEKVWVTQLTTNTIFVALPPLSRGEVVSGTVIFRPKAQPTPPPDAKVSTRYTLRYDDPSGGGKQRISNGIAFSFGGPGSNQDTAGGAIQLLTPDFSISNPGNKLIYTATFLLPDELVNTWLTKPDGTSVPLGSGVADNTGNFSQTIDTTNLPPGTYVVAIYGNRSEVTGSGLLSIASP